MRILITGGAGFIGQHVTRALLKRGHEVVAMVRRPVELGCGVVVGDLRDSPQVVAMVRTIEPEAVVHLAWYAVPGKFWTAPENLDSVSWTLQLAQAATRAGCRRFVGAGSVAEYAWGQARLSEESPRVPETLYGWAKKATQELLEAYFQERASFAWLRYGWTFGPGEPRGKLVSELIAKLRVGEEVSCSEGLHRRDFLYVADLADATAAMVESPVTGAVNVGSGVATPIRQVVGLVEQELGGKTRVEARPKEVYEEVVLDVRRLHDEVGWRPRWTLEEGIRHTVVGSR